MADERYSIVCSSCKNEVKITVAERGIWKCEQCGKPTCDKCIRPAVAGRDLVLYVCPRCADLLKEKL